MAFRKITKLQHAAIKRKIARLAALAERAEQMGAKSWRYGFQTMFASLLDAEEGLQKIIKQNDETVNE